jgi:hypothetical protein
MPAGTRVRILPTRNAAGRIVPDKYELAGKLGSVVKQTDASSILIMRDNIVTGPCRQHRRGFHFRKTRERLCSEFIELRHTLKRNLAGHGRRR